MRYMMLVYSTEGPDGLDAGGSRAAHGRSPDGDGRSDTKGCSDGRRALWPRPRTATTVRVQNGKALVTDGPFAETKEHLAGYYIIDCENLDEAIEWAAKIPTACKGGEGCIEIRPLRGQPSHTAAGGGSPANRSSVEWLISAPPRSPCSGRNRDGSLRA